MITLAAKTSKTRAANTWFKTFRFRVKDSSHTTWLAQKARAVNLIWNYCNETGEKAWRRDRRWLTWRDFCGLTSGASREIGLHSQSVQAVCIEFANKRETASRCRLGWRSARRSLGWIPFTNQAVSIAGDKVQFMGRRFKFWKTREIQGKLKTGRFSQDALGRWYLNLVCEVPVASSDAGSPYVGIDLGLTTQAACSNGACFDRANLTRQYEGRLAIAQRARKKRRVRAIHAKVANSRRDWAHKTSAAIVRQYQQIFVGDVASTKMINRGFAKSTYDAGWGMLKAMLAYKAIALGRDFRVVNENFSTVTCSVCFARSGPSGLGGLGVRQWGCSECGSQHHRDVNAARNILAAGLGHQTPKGISWI